MTNKITNSAVLIYCAQRNSLIFNRRYINTVELKLNYLLCKFTSKFIQKRDKKICYLDQFIEQ